MWDKLSVPGKPSSADIDKGSNEHKYKRILEFYLLISIEIKHVGTVTSYLKKTDMDLDRSRE